MVPWTSHDQDLTRSLVFGLKKRLRKRGPRRTERKKGRDVLPPRRATVEGVRTGKPNRAQKERNVAEGEARRGTRRQHGVIIIALHMKRVETWGEQCDEGKREGEK